MPDEPAVLAARLVDACRTMVLATDGPWAAPVYYAPAPGRYFFFSSERSRHVADALATGRCAAAIFRDSDDWREIEGLQMAGAVRRVDQRAEAADAFDRYVRRFPTVRDFFGGEAFDLDGLKERFHAELYAFVPDTVFYLNNSAGLGSRREIQLSV